jgi:hypothetical protein
MSVARGFPNAGHFYSNIVKPIALTANFIVDAANGNGLGIRSLKSNGYIRNVFMHTSATPGVNDGVTNPNPAVGIALIQFKQNFNVYLGGFSGFVSPVTGSGLTSTTSHLAYIIGTLGTTTLAQWQTAGVPAGLTPSVGMSFIATTGGAIGGTGTVYLPGVSGITSFEVIGDPNQSINNSSIATNGGAYVLVQFLAATSSSTTTLVQTAPATNSVVGMQFYFDGSSVSVDGL